MFSQSFSSDNFRKLLDLDNRRGIYRYPLLDNKIEELDVKIKQLKRELQILKASNQIIAEVENKKKEIKEKIDERESIVEEKLEKLSDNVSQKGFKILLQTTVANKKSVYKTDDTLSSILTLKQLQFNIRKLYKVKQSDKNLILEQLINVLSDQLPKYIIRTDISDFYGSISQEMLLNKLNTDNLLSPLSLKLIKNILINFNHLSNSNVGVPKGIGISPYLTEIFMRSIDDEIKLLPDLIYYARYVDDIVLIFSSSQSNNVDIVQNILTKNLLVINQNKTKIVDLITRKVGSVEYLGYNFIINLADTRTLVIDMSNKRRIRYIKKILSCFTIYKKRLLLNEKKARKTLIKRLRFLTSNTRLFNSKKNIFTGIYFNNLYLNQTSTLNCLDDILLRICIKYRLPDSLTKRITSKFSFGHGFSSRRLIHFSPHELKKIKNRWL